MTIYALLEESFAVPAVAGSVEALQQYADTILPEEDLRKVGEWVEYFGRIWRDVSYGEDWHSYSQIILPIKTLLAEDGEILYTE